MKIRLFNFKHNLRPVYHINKHISVYTDLMFPTIIIFKCTSKFINFTPQMLFTKAQVFSPDYLTNIDLHETLF